MRQHKLALCREHFLDWVPTQTERFIKKYAMFDKDAKVLVAVSGGKDSLSLWDILLQLGYKVDGLYIDLGIADRENCYSKKSLEVTRRFADERGLRLHVSDLRQETGKTITELARTTQRGRGKPCSLCGMVKRHTMNRIARDHGYSVLATGHNLDDEAAVLFGNTLSWSGEYIVRQGPVLPETAGLARKVKPLCRFYEREMAAYAILRGIEYIYEECPFVKGATSIYYKDILNKMENDRPGLKLSFYLRFLQARDSGVFADPDKGSRRLAPCMECGQPTSAQGRCSYCRLIESVQE